MTALRKICSCTTCPSLGKPQEVSKFGKNTTSPDGLHWYCRVCNNAKQREWKLANPEKVREWKQRYIAKNRAKNSARHPRQMELDLK